MYVHCSLGSKTVAHWYEATLQLLIYFLQCSAHLHHTPCREWCPGASKLRLQSFLLLFFYSKVVDADQSRWCRRAFGHSILLSQEGGTDASCWTRTCFQKLWKQPNHVSNNQGGSICSFGLFTMTKHWIIQSRCQSFFQTFFKCWNLGLRR